jgi:rsbT co-antagonist protein RsbR
LEATVYEIIEAQLREILQGGEVARRIEVASDNQNAMELVQLLNELLASQEQYHESTMELALGISEIHELFSEMRRGNYEARASDELLGSEDEIIASVAQAFNETIGEVQSFVERQHFAIQELSTPILEVWSGVLALPIIGVVDTRRSLEIMERLLAAIVEKSANHVIIDITGVEVVDTRTADQFIKVIKAAQLLGTQCVVTGIRPSVAQTLVEIGVELAEMTTLRNLHAGLQYCIRDLERRNSEGSGPAAEELG